MISSLIIEFSPARASTGLDPRRPGTVRMAERLALLARQGLNGENPYLNQGRIPRLESVIAQQPPLEQMIPLRFSLGRELINDGQNQKALAEFDWVQTHSAQTGNLILENKRNLLRNQALALLRIAEFQNCLTNHHADSCLMPIQGGGIHRWKDPSRQAARVLTNLLTEFPDDLAGRWLLTLATMTLGEYPSPSFERWQLPPRVFASEYDIKRFTDVAGPAGLARSDLSGGSVVEDFDGDNLLDVMVTSIGFEDQMHFYRNNGDGTFTDRTAEAGLTGLTGGLNMVSGDYNNDGLVDVFVLRGAWMREHGKFPNSLLRNLGGGQFEDVTDEAGVLSFHPTQTAVWFDFDGDGWLDLYVGNESMRGEPAHPCELYRNNRDGTFREMAAEAGVRTRAFVKGVTATDFNNDGRPDLYLSCRGRANILFRNDGPRLDNRPNGPASGWIFTDVSEQAGTQYPITSFPTWSFDYDNDGWEDLYAGGYRIDSVADVAADYLGLPTPAEKPRLYRNRGNGTFEDATERLGLNRVLHAMGSNFGDLDNDGWLDFYLGTGDPDLLTAIPNRMFRNAQGQRFQDVTTSGGFGNIQKGHGISFADIDNDGDQDVFEEMGGAVSSDVYPNVLFLNPGHGHRWLKLQLTGTKANRAAIGARVKLVLTGAGGQREVHRTVGTGGSFGCNPLRLEIGLGQADQVERVEIVWPGSGTRQIVARLEPNGFYRIREGSDSIERVDLKAFAFGTGGAHEHHHHH